jgi:hypothetical protein
MSKFQMLNNITHKDLRIITKKSAEYGDAVNGCLVYPEEYGNVQKEYPIFFQKDTETGEFQSVAIFGFKQDENLFLDSNGWNAQYIPALMQREPFLIGFQKSEDSEALLPVIHIDMENARISKNTEGELAFLEHGGNSAYIDEMSKTLMLIHEGIDMSKDVFAAFLSLDLIEPFVLDIEFTNKTRYKTDIYFTINQEKLFALDDETLGKLNRAGYLYYAYMVISSLGNIQKLIDMHQKSH